jgi:hypothetical protein
MRERKRLAVVSGGRQVVVGGGSDPRQLAAPLDHGGEQGEGGDEVVGVGERVLDEALDELAAAREVFGEDEVALAHGCLQTHQPECKGCVSYFLPSYLNAFYLPALL